MVDKKINNDLKCPLFIIASDVIRDVLNGKAVNNKLFGKMLELKQNLKPFVAVTTLSSLKRGIYLANKNSTIQNLQVLFEVVEIYPSLSNYKDEKAVIDETVKLANMMSKGDL